VIWTVRIWLMLDPLLLSKSAYIYRIKVSYFSHEVVSKVRQVHGKELGPFTSSKDPEYRAKEHKIKRLEEEEHSDRENLVV